ncbi:MAG: glycine betaine catabolism, partial [Mycobacterium sp.]|nr:glycine betaine catabolism [Mycobacterium sp.]
LVSLHPDYVMTHRLTPLEPGQTYVECSWAFPKSAIATPGFDPAYAVDFWDLTNRQDWAACESVQRGLSSPHARPVRWHPTRTASTSSSPVLRVHTRAGVPLLLMRRRDGDRRGVRLN